MKVALSAAASNSVFFRPSMYEKTNPNIIPKGRPFRKSATTFSFGGAIANAPNINNPKVISATSQKALFSFFISEITLIPANFESI